MSDGSKIEWLARPGTKPASWNPIVAETRGANMVAGEKYRRGWFCTKVDEGCRNCYAEQMNGWRGNGRTYDPANLKHVRLRLDEKILEQPLHWRKPRTVFVCSMTDLFGEFVREDYIDCLLAMTTLCPGSTWIVLTKRADRMQEYFNRQMLSPLKHSTARIPAAWHRIEECAAKMEKLWPMIDSVEWPLPNVWLGVTVTDQKTADERIRLLLNTPAAVRWVSYEPALGPINFADFIDHADPPRFGINWIIAGGESGRKARPAHPDWFRSARDQAVAADVPFFFKQWGAWAFAGDLQKGRASKYMQLAPSGQDVTRWPLKAGEPPSVDLQNSVAMGKYGKHRAGRLLDGREWNEFPVGEVVSRKSAVGSQKSAVET